MLRIRPDHMQALAKQQQAGFASRMVLHLREVFPAEVERLDDAQLGMFVEKVAGRAREWGITREKHVERLIELFASFDELRRRPLPAWVREIVEYPDRPGEQILCRLEDRLFFGEPV